MQSILASLRTLSTASLNQQEQAKCSLETSLARSAAAALDLLQERDRLLMPPPPLPSYVQGLSSPPSKSQEVAEKPVKGVKINRAHHSLLNPTLILPDTEWSWPAFLAEHNNPSSNIGTELEPAGSSGGHKEITEQRHSAEDLLKFDVVAYKFMQGHVFPPEATLEEIRERCFEDVVKDDEQGRKGFWLFCRLRRILEERERKEKGGNVEKESDGDVDAGDMWKDFVDEAQAVGGEILRRAARIVG